MISVAGGHGDVNGLNRDLTAISERATTNACNGADDCRRAVREQISLGAEVIKFAATGGVLSNVAGGLNQQMMSDEMRAVVETARTLRPPGRRPRPRRRRDQRRARGRGQLDRAWHLHQRPDLRALPSDRRLLCADPARARRGAGRRRARRADPAQYAQGARGCRQCRDSFAPGGSRERQYRLRHRQRRQPPRRQCPGIRADGRRTA